MDRSYKARRYLAVDAVPVKQWQVLPHIYGSLLDAKMAAAKLYVLSRIAGVAVKQKQGGFCVMGWRL